MSSEQLHTPREKFGRQTVALHQAIISHIEELEADDWYRQRADDCDNANLKANLLHNMREEIEHASMQIEWLRSSSPDFASQLNEYLFTIKDIVAAKKSKMGKKK